MPGMVKACDRREYPIVLATVIQRIDRFNAAHPWSHNDIYHRWVLRQLPPRMLRTLDVGCGTGNLVLAVSARAEVAEGIDADAAVIEIARQRSAGRTNAVFSAGDFRDLHSDGQYDAVTALAVVHHLPLATTLVRMRTLLAPGGTLVIVGCYQAATRLDFLTQLAAVPANMIIGLARTAHAAEARVAMSAPTTPPQTSLAEVRQVAAEVLPGARIRRRLFWRYSLTYQAPSRGNDEPPELAGEDQVRR